MIVARRQTANLHLVRGERVAQDVGAVIEHGGLWNSNLARGYTNRGECESVSLRMQVPSSNMAGSGSPILHAVITSVVVVGGWWWGI